MRMLRTTLMFALLACPALAIDEMVVVKPGGEGSARKARQFLQDWFGWFGSSGGLELTGSYLNDPTEAEAYFKDHRPAYGIVGFDFYLEHGGALGMQPVLSTLPAGKATERYVVLARPGGPAGPAELAGKRLTGRHVAYPKFATSQVLGGSLEPDQLTVVYDSRTVSAMNAVLDGKADAFVVLEAEWVGIQKNPKYAAQLRAIHTSAPIPTAVAVVFGSHAPGPFTQALTKMNEDASAADLLKTMGSAGFAPIDGPAIEAASRAYSPKAGGE